MKGRSSDPERLGCRKGGDAAPHHSWHHFFPIASTPEAAVKHRALVKLPLHTMLPPT